jgi:hypothetical protein
LPWLCASLIWPASPGARAAHLLILALLLVRLLEPLAHDLLLRRHVVQLDAELRGRAHAAARKVSEGCCTHV